MVKLFVLVIASVILQSEGFSWNTEANLGEGVKSYKVNATETDCNSDDCYCQGLQPTIATDYASPDGVSYSLSITSEQPAPDNLTQWNTKVYYEFWPKVWLEVGSDTSLELTEEKSFVTSGKMLNDESVPNGRYCFIFWGTLKDDETTMKKELLFDVAF